MQFRDEMKVRECTIKERKIFSIQSTQDEQGDGVGKENNRKRRSQIVCGVVITQLNQDYDRALTLE